MEFFAQERYTPPLAAVRYRVLVRRPGAIGQTETLCRELRETRVTLFTREGYYEGTPAPQALDVDVAASREDETFVAAFELQTEVPTVLNEVRIRAVEWDCEAACSDDDRDSGKRRLVPPFIVICSTDGSTFAPPIVTHGGTATDMEARALVLRNAPRRRLVRNESLAALLALPREAYWEQVDRQGCDDLSFSIARALLERQTKLKAFLSSDGGGHRRRLKAWPGKDAVQALAAWWLAALLVADHGYTEPELYAVIEAECWYSPDLGTIRKELVRRGCLEPPSITENADRTTSTTTRVNVEGMRATLEGEWRGKGVI